MKRILTEELPADNYFVLKYVIHFLTEVFFIIVTFVEVSAFTMLWVMSKFHPFWAVVNKSNAG